MASESYNLVVSNTTDQDFIETRGWVHLWANLESSADGENYIAYGGEFARVEPGVTISHVIAPGTKVKIKSTSSDGSRWGILVTELSILDAIMAALCQVGAR